MLNTETIGSCKVGKGRALKVIFCTLVFCPVLNIYEENGQEYKLGRKLGSGAFGEVREGSSKGNNKRLASNHHKS